MRINKPQLFYKTRRHSVTYACITAWQHRIVYIGDGKVFSEYYTNGKQARLHFLMFIREVLKACHSYL